MAQKLSKHGENWEKMSMGCDIDFTILLSMLNVHILLCDLNQTVSQIVMMIFCNGGSASARLHHINDISRVVTKTDFCLGENQGAELRS